MSQDETHETDRGGTPCRALVALAPSAASPSLKRERPLSAFLAQLATSDAPRPARSLRAPEALRRYAQVAALGEG